MKKNLVKKALLPAIVAVLCSLIALTSVSYAWFTMGNEAQVGEIEVNVTAAEGLQISADATSWKSVLPVDSLTSRTETNQFPAGEILPVSSAGNVVDGKLQLFDGVVERDVLTATAAKELDANDTDNFIAFDIYVKLDAQADFKLSTISSVKGYTNNTHTAVRVAFVKLGTAATKAAVDAAGATANTAADAGIIKIWEPNSEIHVASEEEVKKDYKGVSAAGTNPTLTDVTTFDLGDNAETLFTDVAEGITKIRVYIWLEGQDVDCVNDISGDKFTVNLQFEIPEDAQTTN